MSLKTVESTLTRVYRKLGVQSRTDLGDALRTEAATTPSDGDATDGGAGDRPEPP